MIKDHISIFRVRHDDALKAAVALILLDRLFEETTHEGRAGDIRRIVPQHRRHFLIKRLALHLFEADEILFRELCPVPVVEGTDNLGKRLRLVFGIGLGPKFLIAVSGTASPAASDAEPASFC